MRLDLGELAARGLALVLPPAVRDLRERRAELDSVTELRGVFESREAGWTLDQLACGEALLRGLLWTFGKVSLCSDEGARLAGLRGAVHQETGQLRLELELDQLVAARLVLAVGALALSARVEAEALTLSQGSGNGMLVAKRAVFRDFEVSSGDLHVHAPELQVTDLTVDWGGEEFRLEVGTAEAAALDVVSRGDRLRAQGVELLALRSRGPRVQLGRLRLSRGELEAGLGASAASARRDERDAPTDPPLDASLLDTLAGHLNVDVDVDLSVPVLGRRRATHGLRLGIEGGAIDYLELEHGLSALEDAFLDFSVREGKLVLERALPIISTRGRGKPLLLWDLDEAEHARAAREHRVRLSVLPHVRVARGDDEEHAQRTAGGAFKLRALSVRNLDASLSLLQNGAGIRGVLPELTFAALSLRGQLHHRVNEAPPGALRAEGSQLRAVLRDLPLAGRTGAGQLEIAVLGDAEVGFEGLRATHLRAALEGVTLSNLQLR
jgi:hypothetical protein